MSITDWLKDYRQRSRVPAEPDRIIVSPAAAESRPPGPTGRAERGLRQCSRGVASVVLAGSGEGEWTSRGRHRASSPSARRPSRARTRGRNRPRRPARGRACDSPCQNPTRLARVRRSAPASSRRAVHRVLARSAARVGRLRRFRGRDPSRQWRVSRDRRPLVARVAAEHGLPDGRGRSRCTTVGTFPDTSRFYVEFREARTFAVSDLSARLHIITPQRKPTRPRRGRGRVPARSSAAPRCRSAASPP